MAARVVIAWLFGEHSTTQRLAVEIDIEWLKFDFSATQQPAICILSQCAVAVQVGVLM